MDNNKLQEQKENTGGNHDTLTPEAVTSSSNANISGELNDTQVKSTSDEVLGSEVTSSAPVEVNRKDNNNKQEQSSLGTNTGDTQDKEESINANTEATSKKEDEQEAKVNVEEKENAVQGGNTPNEVKERVIANNASTEPTKKLEDAQVKNVLNSIKAQITSVKTPADFERLSNDLAALAASTNNPKLLAEIQSMKAAVDSKEETAKNVIRSDATSNNLEAQEHQDPEMVRKHLEHEERKTRIDKNWAKYEKIEKASRERLITNNRFLDQMYNDPNSLMEEQKRLARGQYHSTEEKDKVERKAQQDIDFAKRTHELHRDLNHAIEHEQEQLKLAPKIEVEQTSAGNDELLQKKQKYEANISLYKERLEQHINPTIAELDLEREKLLKVVDTHSDLVKDRIRIHFEGNIDRYEEMKILKGDPKALEEMEQLIKKVGLENELNTKSRDKEALPQSKDGIASSLSDISSNNKRHNIFEETLNIRSEYKLGGEEKKVIRNIQIKGIGNLGWLGDAQKITGKPVTGPTSPVGNVAIAPPKPTPNMQKFAARGADIIKK